MTKILTGGSLPNIPWEDKPASVVNAPVWRFSGNPVIDRNPGKGRGAHLQQRRGALWGRAFVAVARRAGHGTRTSTMGLFRDAIHWKIDENKIPFVDEEGKPFMPGYAYDPRLVKVEDTYYIMWCTGLLRRGP